MTHRARERGLILYCGLGGPAYYPGPGPGVELERFLDRCEEARVAELVFYFGFVHAGEPTALRLTPTRDPFEPADLLATFHLYKAGDPDPWIALVHGASARGLWVTGYTSPNYQGATLPTPTRRWASGCPFSFSPSLPTAIPSTGRGIEPDKTAWHAKALCC